MLRVRHLMGTSRIDAHLFNVLIQIQWTLNLGTSVHLSIEFFFEEVSYTIFCRLAESDESDICI